jgi:hypothetical protein
MVLSCPLQSLAPRFSADPLAKPRRLWRAGGTILFERLQFFMPLLGRNRHLLTYEKQNPKIAKAKEKNSH